jgi:hypothetical protein
MLFGFVPDVITKGFPPLAAMALPEKKAVEREAGGRLDFDQEMIAAPRWGTRTPARNGLT